MSDHSTIDPELAAALAVLPRGANGSMMDLSDIPALRDGLAAAAAHMPPAPVAPGVHVETLTVHRTDGTPLDVHLYIPDETDGPLSALLWFHAGGQILGSGRGDDAYHSGLALSLGSVVGAVDYRLAPETPAPGAAEDGYLAYTSLIAAAETYGIDPARIGIAGASGGGAPAAATALMIRDRDALPPALLLG